VQHISVFKFQNIIVYSYLLDVVVRKSASILKLLSGEDQSLLVRGNALLVLDLGLDIVDCVGRLHLKGDGLTRQGLDEAIDASVLSSLNSTIFEICRKRWRG